MTMESALVQINTQNMSSTAAFRGTVTTETARASISYHFESTVSSLLSVATHRRFYGGPTGSMVLHDNTSRMSGHSIKPPPFSLQSYFGDGSYLCYGYIGPVITFFVAIMNILFIVTIVKGKFRTSTHTVIVAIAIADILTGVIPFPFNIHVFSIERNEDFLTLEWCYVFEIFQIILPTFFHLVSLSLTVGLSIERFFVITFPLKAKLFCTVRNGIIFCLVIFVVSLGIQMESFFDVDFIAVETPSRKGNFTIGGCIRTEKDKSHAMDIAIMTVNRFIPCVLLVIFTILLLRKSSEVQKWRKSRLQTSTSVSSLERMDLAVSLIAVIVCVSESIIGVILLVEEVIPGRQITKTDSLLSGIVYVTYVIISPINFAILCLLSSRFRLTLKELLLRCTERCHFSRRQNYKNSVHGSTETELHCLD